MIPPTSIDGTDITGATIDGTDVQEITVDGDTVFTATPVPPDQGNLAFHMDAFQESLSNNQTTTTVTDFSGNGNDFTGDSITYKTNQINGLPAFEFTNDFLSNSQTISDPYVNAFVCRTDVNNSNRRLWGDAGSINRNTVDSGQFYTGYGMQWGSGFFRSQPSSPVPIGTYQTIIYEVNGSSSNIFVNGAIVSSGTMGSDTVTGLNLGTADSNSSRAWNGQIAEFLNYGTTTNIQDILTYFNDKYNL